MSDKRDLYQTGDNPPDGVYACAKCTDNNPETVIIPSTCECLPECPHCGFTHWYKV